MPKQRTIELARRDQREGKWNQPPRPRWHNSPVLLHSSARPLNVLQPPKKQPSIVLHAPAEQPSQAI